MSIFSQSFPKANGFIGCCASSKESSSHPFSVSRYSQDVKLQQRQLLTGEDKQKKQEIDTLLSEAFNTLTFEERQIQQEEVHGVADEIAEEASLMEKSLQDFESHINKKKTGSVYETAERQDPKFVHARDFRIMFLRAERYNAKAAADRMMRFFEVKEELFGTEMLTKDITIQDLDEDDLDSLKSGSIQWAGKDRSNRPILLQIPGLRKFKDLKNELRQRYFIMMEAVKNSSEAQIRGIVALNISLGDLKDSRKGRGYLENARVAEALPIYVGAFHDASDDPVQQVLGNVVISIMPTALRARVRLHFGTHLECQYLLSTYGIPPGLLPFVPETNTIDMGPHLQWCQKCFARDGTDPLITAKPASTSSSGGPVITEPNPNDVLSAGSKKSDNIGNDRLRVLVKDFVEIYRAGSYDEKRRIVDHVIGEIHGAGGRFLKQEKGSMIWKELSLTKVRMKITQRFRNHNRRRASASQQAREGALIAGTPLPNDVIFGRAPRNKGTELLHHLIKDRSEDYEALSRGMKVTVVDGIIERVKSEGGRFLQPTADLGGYVELSTDSVRDRISTYFRNYRRPSKNTATR